MWAAQKESKWEAAVQKAHSALPFLVAELMRAACDDPARIVVPTVILPLIQERLNHQALQHAEELARLAAEDLLHAEVSLHRLLHRCCRQVVTAGCITFSRNHHDASSTACGGHTQYCPLTHSCAALTPSFCHLLVARHLLTFVHTLSCVWCLVRTHSCYRQIETC